MSEPHYMKAEREAAEKVAAMIELPLPIVIGDDVISGEGTFDPWNLFPLFGTYSSEFDQCALDVLRELRDMQKKRGDLASEMFREMLCHLNLCDYGTSPRYCFPTADFKKVLPALIEKWEAYAKLQWGEDEE